MEPPVPNRLVEQPLSLDVSGKGRMAVLDRGGRRLTLSDPQVVIDLDEPGVRCRFHGEQPVVLGADGFVRSFDARGNLLGQIAARAGALHLAFTLSGGLVVSYGRQQEVTLERFGTAPIEYTDAAVLDACCLAVESGGLWIAGTGPADPPARAVRLRPVAGGFKVRETVALTRPPRATGIGPDGALYVVLEPGETVLRVAGGRADAPQRLAMPVHDLARAGRTLWSCGPRGLHDLTHLVPPAADQPDIDLPPCTP